MQVAGKKLRLDRHIGDRRNVAIKSKCIKGYRIYVYINN